MKINLADIHLYYCTFDESRPLPDYQAILSADELERGQRYFKEADRKRFYTVYSLLRQTLATYLNLEAKNIHFEKNNYGKPFILKSQNPDNLQFNLSHSKHNLLLGCCRQHHIGVDIEETDRALDFNNLAKHILSDSDLKTFLQLSETDKLSSFFKAWSRKEAFIKAIGKGMYFPLKKLSVSFLPHQSAQILDIQDEAYSKEDWALSHLDFDGTAIGAIATDKPNAQLNLYPWR